MAAKNANTSAQKWLRNYQGSTQSVKDGVNGVTEAPTAKAARNLDKAKAGYIDAVDSGRMGRALNAVSLEDWKRAMLNKGINRMSTGATEAVGKVEAFLSSWMPLMEQVSQQVKLMPSGTTEAALDRVRKVIEAGKRFAGKMV